MIKKTDSCLKYILEVWYDDHGNLCFLARNEKGMRVNSDNRQDVAACIYAVNNALTFEVIK